MMVAAEEDFGFGPRRDEGALGSVTEEPRRIKVKDLSPYGLPWMATAILMAFLAGR